MAKKKSSFGMLVLIIVTAVVLYLAAKGWEKLAPSATQVTAYDSTLGANGPSTRSNDSALADAPDLEETRQTTDAHAADVQEALAAID